MAPPKKPSHQRVSSNPFKKNSNKKPDLDEEVGTVLPRSSLLLRSCLPSASRPLLIRSFHSRSLPHARPCLLTLLLLYLIL